MSGTITRGTTFTLGQQEVTVAIFVPVLTSATVQDVDRDNVNPLQATFVTQQTAALDNPYSEEMWQDELTHALKVFLVTGAGGGGGLWNSALSLGLRFIIASLGTAVVPGDLLRPATGADAGDLTQTVASSADQTAYAVSAEPVSPGDAGICIKQGPVKVKCSGTVNAGEAVVVSTSAAGAVQSAGAAGTGYGPRVFGVAISNSSGGYVWICLRR